MATQTLTFTFVLVNTVAFRWFSFSWRSHYFPLRTLQLDVFCQYMSWNSLQHMFGICSRPTCSCSPLLSLLLIMRRMRPFLSSVTRSVTIPSTSMFCRPPSRPQVSVIFSSTRRCTLERKCVRTYNQSAVKSAEPANASGSWRQTSTQYSDGSSLQSYYVV